MTMTVASELERAVWQRLDEVAELFAEQASGCAGWCSAGVRAPEPLVEDACQLAWVAAVSAPGLCAA